MARMLILAGMVLILQSAGLFAQEPQTGATSGEATPQSADSEAESDDEGETSEQPWDYSPYRVLIWVASHHPNYTAETLREPLLEYLDRDFYSIWRTTVADAPPPVATAAFRSMENLSYDGIVASDPVIAVKRDHEDAIRIQSVRSLPEYVEQVPVTKGMRVDVINRAEAFGDETLGGSAMTLKDFDRDAQALASTWSDPSTEALMLTRGQAATLDEPKAKMLPLPITDLIGSAVDQYDKIYVVRIIESPTGSNVAVAEMETLMRFFGQTVYAPFSTPYELPSVVGHAVTAAFSPMVRIDDAGQQTAVGMVRAANLIMDPDSPARVPIGSALLPMIRKNDRNGKPIGIGRVDWAFLIATEHDGPYVKMDYYSGRAGGLQGRKNKRTFKMGMLLNPFRNDTLLRLHVKGREDLPLIGYELYERELKSKSMTFVGRTDWNGRLVVERTENPMRLLYVKNGGAVLARLPLVPGYTPMEVADLTGDDMRLQAESYIRGVQNAIIDLVALRKLLAARIRLRLRKGQINEAQELLDALREQPTNDALADDMGRKQGMFLKEIGTRNANQRRKVDLMFKETREMLGKQISPQIIRDLEADMAKAKANGGRLPEEPEESES